MTSINASFRQIKSIIEVIDEAAAAAQPLNHQAALLSDMVTVFRLAEVTLA